MQITGLPDTPRPLPNSASARPSRPEPTEQLDESLQDGGNRSLSISEFLQRLDSLNEGGRGQQSLQDVPARNRGAISSYLNNGPSLSELTGVELAGVDTFA